MAYPFSQPVCFGAGSSDAFGRGRVGEPETVINLNYLYDSNPLLAQIVNVGAGSCTKTINIATMTLSTGGNTSGDGSVLQSRLYARYEPGKSQLIQMTGVIGAAKANVRSMIGYFDNNDGIFFDQNNGINVTVRTSTSGSAADTAVAQANWNLDKMNGTGPSGITLDFTKVQIFVIDLQWLGAGRVRYGFSLNGRLYYCHEVLNANSVAIPYMNTGSLPIRWEIRNTATASGATTMTANCGSTISEGGNQLPQTIRFSADNGVTTKASSSATVPVVLLSISPALTYDNVVNRGTYKVLGGKLLNASSTPGQWGLYFNPSLAGTPAFAAANGESGMTVDIAATNIGGITISSTSTTGGVTTITWAGNSINGASQGLNNHWEGYKITLSGYTGGDTGNNGTFTITSSTGTTITFPNASGTSGSGGVPVFVVPGYKIASGFFQQQAAGGVADFSNLEFMEIPFTIDYAGQVGDVYSLATLTIGGSTDNMLGQLFWTEDR